MRRCLSCLKDNELQSLILDIKLFGEKWKQEHSELKPIISLLNEKDQEEVFNNIRMVILRILIEMKSRLPIELKIMKQAQVIFLKTWSSEDWRALALHFTNIIPENDLRHFNLELQRFENSFEKHAEEHKNNKSIIETWTKLSGKYKYLAKLAKALLVLPSSTVPVERIFSQMQDFKTPKRNRLTVQNIESCMLIYQAFGNSDFEL